MKLAYELDIDFNTRLSVPLLAVYGNCHLFGYGKQIQENYKNN